MEKVALFAFKGEPLCFVHVLLNALDMKEKGIDVKIIIEGAAVKLIPEFSSASSPLEPLFDRAFGLDLIDGVCMACSHKMGTQEEAKALGIQLLSDMSGHPGIARYRMEGYEILTF